MHRDDDEREEGSVGESGSRRAVVIASEQDARMPRQFLDAVLAAWSRDAQMMEGTVGVGALQASAAEVAEFGCGDADRGELLFQRSAAHTDADPRAFAGLRRAARRARDLKRLAEVYRLEIAAERSAAQVVLATVGAVQLGLREEARTDKLIMMLRDVAPQLEEVTEDLRAVYRATLEDVLVRAGRKQEALAERVERWAQFEEASEADWRADGALALAVLADLMGAPEADVLDWFREAFDRAPSLESGRPLLRAAYDAGDTETAAALLAELAQAADGANVRCASYYELALLRAYRFGQRAAALEAMREAMRDGITAPVAAAGFLALSRSATAEAVPDDLLDALDASIAAAASDAERADLLVQMAQRLAETPARLRSAVGLANEALAESPGYKPALRLLATLLLRESNWGQLAEVLESECAGEEDLSERIRLHERLAEIYEEYLGDAASSERHLREALELRPEPLMVRRLARLLTDQMRWADCFELLLSSSRRVAPLRDRVVFLEEAAVLAEMRMRDLERAAAAYEALLDVAPEHPAAWSSLGRNYAARERWADYLRLADREVAQLSSDKASRISVLCRVAEVCRRAVGDLTLAERYWLRALDEDVLAEEALRGLGQLLQSQGRWEDLATLTERVLRASTVTTQRLRCLRQLGEWYAVHLSQPELAMEAWRQVAELSPSSRDEAQMWMERLNEAMGHHEARLTSVVARAAEAQDAVSRARLRFRAAEILEWSLLRPGEAFAAYLDALDDAASATAAVSGVDRLWTAEGVSDADRERAVSLLLSGADRAGADLRQAMLELAVERGGATLSEVRRLEVWSTLAGEDPSSVRASEHCAIEALRAGDARLAFSFRSSAPAGPVEQAVVHWHATDLHGVVPDAAVATDMLPEVARFLVRESAGSSDRAEVQEPDRALLLEIAGAGVPVGALVGLEGGELQQRLAIAASRALGRNEAMVTRWQELARGMGDAVRAIRAWLDLAAEPSLDGEERSRSLREAAALGCYGSEIRNEVYAALWNANDLDGLEQAIADHLAEAPPAPDGCAALAARRARALEQLKRPSDAIDALGVAVLYAPAETSYARDKSRLEELGGNLEAARATIEDCLASGCRGEGRVELLGRLASLHQGQGGDKARTLAALEEAHGLIPRSREWTMRLASAHGSFGDPQRCVELLEGELPTPPEVGDQRSWILLAKTYWARLKRPAEGEAILWRLFEAFPDRAIPLSGLEEFYRVNQGAQLFADRLAGLLAENRLDLAPETLGELWCYVGELNFSVLRRFREAEDAFAQARRARGPVAKTLLREARAAGQQPGRVRDAVTKVLTALQLGDASIWDEAAQELDNLYEEMKDAARLRVARQIRRAFGANVDTGDPNALRDPTQELETAVAWRHGAHDLVSTADVETLRGIMPLAEKVLSRSAPNRRDYPSVRLRGDESAAFEAYLQGACNWLAIEPPKVVYGSHTNGVIGLEPKTFAVPAARVTPQNQLGARFWAGYTAGMALSGVVPLSWVDDQRVQDFIVAVAIKGLDMQVAGGSPLSDDVAGLLLHSPRRAAAAALRENPDLIRGVPAGWSLLPSRLGDRLGLVFCGDVSVAISEILVAEGWNGRLEQPQTQEVITSSARCTALLRYALSDEYYLLRYESGLSQRPWLLG